ncbi:MAG: hypothetical protein IT443_10960 [Phycisphaeraceae bacterium]|nr:hypothetical protein [Phycisphaeraceae bacterium]
MDLAVDIRQAIKNWETRLRVSEKVSIKIKIIFAFVLFVFWRTPILELISHHFCAA